MTLFERVFKGSDEVYEQAVKAVDSAIEEHGADYAVSLPNTAYNLPCYYSFKGAKVKTLGELKEAMGVIKGWLKHDKRTSDVFTSGIGAALCAEVIETLKYVKDENCYDANPYHGHLSDAEIRELGVPLVTGDIPGVAVIIGPAPSDEQAAAPDEQAE